ncbi:Fe-S cluster assembly ATPase SufC [Insolitispirillum peregrinum]|uniref:Fe-S cluster assembly ATP-binding protein n=1 Tax=Insolitispirillum peregrinum TaxID=80876 RepID=A0A1N7LIC1_9PROT|nr:Fe-S cluster assembly ATPase SufC [Insolitispirillum peregrinum]SIS73556.1 Fe-S cluster assembly ATP-binding protein [Insolitispirillum peregrinum]
MALIEIQNLHASVDGKEILKGVDLVIEPGTVHALMGPNGTGKSTLSNIISGRPGYQVTEGRILLNGEDIADMEPDQRANAGIFLAFQYPVEIPGVASSTFLKAAINAKRRFQGLGEIDAMEFLKLVKGKAKELGIRDDMLKRPVNVGFSGGEKKRADILQMALLQPQFAILDETDSGLDIDALRVVSEGVNSLRTADRSFLVITHYQRLLSYIVPDVVHVFAGGKIVRSGGPELAEELEAKGYADYVSAA